MEYTDHYTYVLYKDTDPLVESFTTVLNFSTDRTPYALVEVIAVGVNTSTKTEECLTLRTKEIAQNFTGSDNKGTILGVLAYEADHDPNKHSYTLSGFAPKLMFANARSLEFFFADNDGAAVTIGAVSTNVLSVNMLLKVSYPKVGEIPPLYRTQIPL